MKSGKIFVIAALILAASLVYAGGTASENVVVEINADGSGSASGDMTAARTSDNDVEIIGCGIKGFQGGGFPSQFGFCQAADSDDVYVNCTTLIKRVKAVSQMRCN